jgi:hypothetical protein
VSRLRTLRDVADAAERQGLKRVHTQLREVLIECPVCREAGVKSLACITVELHTPIVRCRGCEAWGDDPFDVLYVLGHDPDRGEPYEIPLRVFQLLEAMHRLGVAA